MSEVLSIGNVSMDTWQGAQGDFSAILDLPPCPATVKAIQSYRKHDGSRATIDEERALAIVAARVSGISERAIARQYRVSRNTIPAVMAIAQERGIVEPLKQRLARQYARLAELAVDAQIEAVAAGTLPENVLAATGGIATDKMLLLMGEATERVEVKRDEGGPEWARYLAERTKALGLAPESESGSAVRQVVAAQVVEHTTPAGDTAHDTVPPAPAAPIEGPAVPGKKARKAGGGGCPSARPPQN